MNRALCALVALTILAYTPAAAYPPAVTVSVYKAVGTSTYHYAIANKSTRPVVAVEIGNDSTLRRCELLKVPAGWTPGASVPSSGATAPAGWLVDAFRDEESGKVCVVLRADESTSASDVAPGTNLSGFSVTAEAVDDSYLYSSVTIVFSDGAMFRDWVLRIDPPL